MTAIGDLRLTIEMSPESGVSTSLIETILQSRVTLNDPAEDCKNIMTQHEAILNNAKAIARAGQDMVGKANIQPECLSDLSKVCYLTRLEIIASYTLKGLP